jgi:predicted dehydrogenase
MIRWGFLSTAQIGGKNWNAVRQAGDVVAGIASRDLPLAQQVIAQRQSVSPFSEVPRAYGSYEALLASPEIDAVYVPIPTGVRAPWVIRAAEAGKHVLCEKPCANNLAELETMIAACARAGVQFMDGVMFMHSLRLQELFGPPETPAGFRDLREIESVFHTRLSEAKGSDNVRLSPELEPMGCLGDLGWYCIRLALWAAGWRLPLRAVCQSQSWQTPGGERAAVPTRFEGRLEFDEGLISNFSCSFQQDLTQWACLRTAAGETRIENFVVPPGEVPDQAQETRMFREFAGLVRSGRHAGIWPDISLRTQQVVDACMRSARAGGEPMSISR